MAPQENKAFVRRMIERTINAGELDRLDEFLAADFTSHEDLPPGISPSREGIKQLFAMIRGAFPDLRATIEDTVAEDDRVVVRLTFSGTHEGDFMGIPPTGRCISYAAVDIFRVADVQVAEHWGVVDTMGLMQELGAIPGAGAGAGQP